MPRQFRCEACNVTEYANPHTLCNHCNDDFRLLRELAKKLRESWKIWNLSNYEVIRTVMNRLIAEVNEFRKGK